MASDFPAERGSAREGDDIESKSSRSLPKQLTAPTTNRRIGRSMRHQPGPLLNDVAGDATASVEETSEDLGTSLTATLRNVLKTRKGMEELKEGLDGRPMADRSAHETERLSRTMAQLGKERTFGVAVFAISRLRKTRLRFPDGSGQEVTLGPHQRTVWSGYGGQRAIVVAIDLPDSIRMDEVLGILADEVETIAIENRVRVKPGGVLQALRRIVAQWRSASADRL